MTLRNLGGYPAPSNLVVTFTDGTTETIHQGPEIWQGNRKETVARINQSKTVKSLVLDNGIFLDANPKNNTWEQQ